MGTKNGARPCTEGRTPWEGLFLLVVDDFDVGIDHLAVGLLGLLRLGSGTGVAGVSRGGFARLAFGAGTGGLGLLVKLGAELLEILQGGLHLRRIVGLEVLLAG